jgi:tetratricopeptide (TPR) repeat protein
LFARYASGDKVVVLRELRTPDDFERVRPDLTRTFGRWRSESWSAERAAFALEVAIAAFARHWPNPQLFLDAARDLVPARPDPPGARPEADRFELCFHRVVAAMLATVDSPHSVESYLTSIQRRVMIGSDASKSAVLKDARLVMAHAMAREAQTLMLLLSVSARRDNPRAWAVAPGDGGTRRQLEEIAQLLELAAADDDARAEASVRRAFLLYRLGANKEALALLEAATPSDDVVDFWRVLIQGRVLLALGRQQDAISAFERATALSPDAQTPAVALMTIFLKSGDRELALGWAERARTTTENRGDPWPLYWSGYSRFLVRWLGELREFQK